MIAVMALLLFAGVAFFASTTLKVAVPLYALSFLLALLWAAKLAFAEAVSWKRSAMHWLVAAFALYSLVRYFGSPLEYESRLELFQVAICTFIYFVSCANFYHPRDRTILLYALLLLAVAESLFAAWQFVLKPTTLFGFERPEMYVRRASGTFFCPNHLAGFLEIVLCLIVARLAMRTSRSNIQNLVIEKVFLAFGGVIIIIGLLSTMSRGGWLSVLVGLSLLVFFGGWKWASFWPRILVAGAGLGLIALLAVNVEALNVRVLHTYSLVRGEADGAANFQVSTLGPRVKIWKSTIQMIRDHPVLGTGAGTWQWIYPKYRPEKVPSNPEYVHNDFLNLASDYGILGFILVGAGVLFFYRHAYRLSKSDNSSEERAFAVGSLMAVTALMAHSIFDFNLHIFSTAVLFMVLVGCTMAIDLRPGAGTRDLLSPKVRYALAIVLCLFVAAGVWFVGRPAMAYHYMGRGDAASSSLQYDAALGYYQKALRLESRSPYTYAAIGDVYLAQAQWRRPTTQQQQRQELARKALEWYEKSLAHNPYFIEVMLRVARAWDMLENKPEVLKVCDQMTRLDPLNPVPFTFLGSFYLHQQDYDKAEKAALRAQELGYNYFDETPDRILEEIRSVRKPQ